MYRQDRNSQLSWRRLEGEPAVERWQGIVDLIARLTDAQSVVITDVIESQLRIVHTNDHPENPFTAGDCDRLDRHFCHQTVTLDKPVIITDATKLRQWRDAPEVKLGFRAYMGHPIHWPDGKVFGTLCILRNRPTNWPTEERELIDEFTAVLESHLMLIYQRHELARRIEQVRIMAPLLPVCPSCLQRRNDAQYWRHVERFISSQSHQALAGLGCPNCQPSSGASLDPDLPPVNAGDAWPDRDDWFVTPTNAHLPQDHPDKACPDDLG